MPPKRPATPVDDSWKHRSRNMVCATCIFFVPKDVPAQQDVATFNRAGYLGRCRRHAPRLEGFPAVFQADWCGDHKLNESNLAGVAS